jgi:hypothetical protein
MRGVNWRIPILRAVVGGVVGYLAIASAGVGASPYFAQVGDPDPPPDIFALRAARHRLIGLASGVLGRHGGGRHAQRLRPPDAGPARHAG